MLKKILLSTILGLSLISTSVYADPKAEGDEIYNPNKYRVECDLETNQVLLIPDYFKPIYEDENSVIANYIPMYFKGELFPVPVQLIHVYYYYDGDSKVYVHEGMDIYNINGNDYISIRED